MTGEPTGQRRILALIDDLMAASRIEATLGAAGYAVRSVPAASGMEVVREWRPDAVVISFGSPSPAWERAIRAIRTDAAIRATPVLAFGPHVDAAGREAAAAAGATRVVTNGAFFSRMAAFVAGMLAGVDQVGEAEAVE